MNIIDKIVNIEEQYKNNERIAKILNLYIKSNNNNKNEILDFYFNDIELLNLFNKITTIEEIEQATNYKFYFKNIDIEINKWTEQEIF